MFTLLWLFNLDFVQNFCYVSEPHFFSLLVGIYIVFNMNPEAFKSYNFFHHFYATKKSLFFYIEREGRDMTGSFFVHETSHSESLSSWSIQSNILSHYMMQLFSFNYKKLRISSSTISFSPSLFFSLIHMNKTSIRLCKPFLILHFHLILGLQGP